MNETATRVTTLLMGAAAACAALLAALPVQACDVAVQTVAPARPAAAQEVQVQRVIITAKRPVQVDVPVQRVVITGKRPAPEAGPAPQMRPTAAPAR